jgi:prepilin-type N-terminal cleavage/methylation domain-containing protein
MSHCSATELRGNPSTQKKRRRSAGFTLVEVMMAAAVLALAISTSVTTLQYGFRTIDTARNTTIASQVLQSMIEDIRLLSWSGTGGPGGVNVANLTSVTDGTLAALDFDSVNHYQSNSITGYSGVGARMLAHFTFSRTVSDMSGMTDASGNSNMKVIVLTAKWTGIDGQKHTLKYTTYYARDGLYAYYNT